MTAESANTKTFRLSRRLSVEISVSRIGITAEWIPATPVKLTDGELSRYRTARTEMLKKLSEKLGGNIVVIEA